MYLMAITYPPKEFSADGERLIFYLKLGTPTLKMKLELNLYMRKLKL